MKSTKLAEFIRRHRLDLIGLGVAAAVTCLFLLGNQFVFQPMRADAQRTSCQSNLKQVGLAMTQYVRNYDEKMPMAHNWADALDPYLRGFGSAPRPITQLACPSVVNWQYGYAYHQKVERQSLAVFPKPDKVILFFDSSANRRSAADNGSSLASPPRHIRQRNNICYLDGHVKSQLSVDFKDKWNKFRPAPLIKWKNGKVSTR